MKITLLSAVLRDGLLCPIGARLDLPDEDAVKLVQSQSALMGWATADTGATLSPWDALLAAAGVVSIHGQVLPEQERALRAILLDVDDAFVVVHDSQGQAIVPSYRDAARLALQDEARRDSGVTGVGVTADGRVFGRDHDLSGNDLVLGSRHEASVPGVVAAPASVDAATVPALPATLGDIEPPLVSTSDTAPPLPAMPALSGAATETVSPAPITPDAPRDVAEGEVRLEGAIDPAPATTPRNRRPR